MSLITPQPPPLPGDLPVLALHMKAATSIQGRHLLTWGMGQGVGEREEGKKGGKEGGRERGERAGESGEGGERHCQEIKS